MTAHGRKTAAPANVVAEIASILAIAYLRGFADDALANTDGNGLDSLPEDEASCGKPVDSEKDCHEEGR